MEQNPKTSKRTPDAGAVYTRPAARSLPDAGLDALKSGAALVAPSRAVLRLSGRKPVELLNAVLTNEVPEGEHAGVYAFLLNPKGRIQTDLRVLKSGEEVLVVTEPEGAEAAKVILGRYAPFSRVQVEDLSDSLSVLGLYGPRAQELLGGLKLAEHETSEVEIDGERILAAGVAVPVAGYDLISASRTLREHLIQQGAVPVGLAAYETARIEAAIPRFGADITTENFPAETGVLDRAVSFEKGCYPGQETVARMRYRGHPNRTLRRFAIEGPPPEPGMSVLQNGREVGNITSVAPLPVDGERLALGYLHRKADPRGPLQAAGATVSVLDG